MAKKRNGSTSKSRLPDTPRSEQAIFDDLAVLCALPGFIHAIAYFCFRDNFVRFEDQVQPEDMARLNTGKQLIRTEIDTLLGLLAKQPIDFSLPGGAKIQQMVDKAEELLEELHQSMISVWFSGLTPEKIASGFDPFDSAAGMREPIFYGGDSAYDFQYRELSPRKYSNDVEWLGANVGFDIRLAARLSSAIARVTSKKHNLLSEQWMALHPDQWTVLPAFSFTVDEVCEASGVAKMEVEAFVNSFCMSVGGGNPSFNTLNDYNAVVGKPILHGENGSFLLLQNYSLTEAIYEAPFYWMGADKKYVSTALKNRGDFTEEVAFDFLRRVFGARVYKNVRIFRSKDLEVGEVDVLVLFGNRAIVLQAKSKRLTLEARRGNDRQIRDDFKKAIQDSYEQGLICSKAIIAGECRLVSDGGAQIFLEEPPAKIYPLCIVADHYPALAAQARQFLRTENVDGVAPPLVADLFTLDAMTEMLQSPLFFLSYLDLRAMHGKKLLAPQELTLLSAHLKRNLWVDDKFGMVAFDQSISADLDIAMLARRRGLPGSKTPEGILTRYKGKALGIILSQIESDPDGQKIDFGLLLMAFSEASTGLVNQAIDTLRRKGAADRQNHDFSAFFSEVDAGITIHCNDDDLDFAKDRLFGHCSLRKYAQKAKRWFGLIISAQTGNLRAGLQLDAAWERDANLDQVTKEMSPGISMRQLRSELRPKKIGRNDPCMCGSGRKYKKCCLGKAI